MNKKLLNLYGLKFNPFAQQVPASALLATPPIESFCWRIEQQIGEGGFALTTGDPGSGKSAALRILAERLSAVRDLSVGLLTRPQANLADFYRELGHLFGVPLSPHNRWNSAKVLREKWLAHIEASVHRPVLLVDEAQEMNTSVFSELRLLASADLDSRSILTIILAGDQRLLSRLEELELLPIASRIRSRLRLETHSPKQLLDCLTHLLKAAGNPFTQTVNEVGTASIAESWRPFQEISKFFPLLAGCCPTLLLPCSIVGRDALLELYACFLATFRNGYEVLEKVRSCPGDPWKRIEHEPVGLESILRRFQATGRIDTGERALTAAEARELAATQLEQNNEKAELRAFLLAWKGSIDFQARDSTRNRAMPLEDFADYLAMVVESCEMPVSGNE